MSTTILQVLFNNTGHPLNETVLLAEVRLMSSGCGESQFRADLMRLKTAGMVSFEEDQITGDRLWKIEPKGSQRITGGR
jgi:hypothetical protein